MTATALRSAASRFLDSPLVPRTLASIVRHRQLAWTMTRRELTESHAGTAMGVVWTFLHPVLTISVYLFLYGVVFKARTGVGGTVDYGAYLLSGLLPWLVCQEALTRSARSILGNAGLVKKVLFPVELLPFKSVLASFCTGAILLAVYVVFRLVRDGSLAASVLLLPLLTVLLFLALFGVGLVISVLSAYFRDIPEIVRVFTTLNVYLIPVVYLPEWLPAALKPVLYLNPFSYVVWCFQDALFYGSLEHPIAWIVFSVLALVSFAGGHLAFRKLKPFLGSVL